MTSQFHPCWRGVSTRWWRLTPKVTAATTPATATRAPRSAVRKPTPRPRSNDIPTPATAAGPSPEPATAALRGPGRAGACSKASSASVRAARHAGRRARSRARAATQTKPSASTATLTENPGWISARRARPIGVSGDRAKATTTTEADAEALDARKLFERHPLVVGEAAKEGRREHHGTLGLEDRVPDDRRRGGIDGGRFADHAHHPEGVRAALWRGDLSEAGGGDA